MDDERQRDLYLQLADAEHAYDRAHTVLNNYDLKIAEMSVIERAVNYVQEHVAFFLGHQTERGIYVEAVDKAELNYHVTTHEIAKGFQHDYETIERNKSLGAELERNPERAREFEQAKYRIDKELDREQYQGREHAPKRQHKNEQGYGY